MLENSGDAQSLSFGLSAAAQELGWGRDRQSLRRLAESLRRGRSLDNVASKGGTPEELVELVKAGAESGRLPQLLNEYLETSRAIHELRRSLFVGLSYPLTLLVLAISVLGGGLVMASEFFRELFMDFGLELPGLTVLLLSIADLLMIFWVFPVALLGIALLLFLIRSFLPWKVQRAMFFQAFPIVGTAQRNMASAEFCWRLATLCEANLPMERSLRVLSESLHDARLRAVSSMLAEEVEDGADPTTFAEGVPGMLAPLSGTFRWVTVPEIFIEGLRAQAEIFEGRARTKIDQVLLIVGPIVLVTLGSSILLITVAFFLPVIQLLSWLV